MFSVVIPTYRVPPEWVTRALDSVFANDTTLIHEVIVCDATPKDWEHYSELYQVFDKYDVTVIKQTGRGVSQARNQAVAAATGEYIAFLDADDYWYPDYLDEHSLAYPESDITIAPGDGHILVISQFTGKESLQAIGFNDHDMLTHFLPYRLFHFLHRKAIWFSGLTMRRAIYGDGFSEELSLFEDLELLMRLTRDGTAHVTHLDTRLWFFNYHEDSSCRGGTQCGAVEHTTFEQGSDYMAERYPPKEVFEWCIWRWTNKDKEITAHIQLR